MSPRKDRPLITVNCAALPGNLIESKLFGREKGAFTGAAAILGLHPGTLRARMHKLGIVRPETKESD